MREARRRRLALLGRGERPLMIMSTVRGPHAALTTYGVLRARVSDGRLSRSSTRASTCRESIKPLKVALKRWDNRRGRSRSSRKARRRRHAEQHADAQVSVRAEALGARLVRRSEHDARGTCRDRRRAGRWDHRGPARSEAASDAALRRAHSALWWRRRGERGQRHREHQRIGRARRCRRERQVARNLLEAQRRRDLGTTRAK